MRVVDIFAFEERPVNRKPLCGGFREQPRQVGVVYAYPHDSPHRGLHDFGVETVGRGFGADDVRNSEPVGQPDDRAQVAGVLYVVERQRQSPFQLRRPQVVMRRFDQCQRVVGGFQQREPFHFARGDDFHFRAFENPFQCKYFAYAQVRCPQFADEFFPFGDKKSVLRAAAFVGQCADKLYFGFCHRCFSMV